MNFKPLAALGLLSLAAAAPASSTVQRWAPAGVATGQFESHAAFDPRTGDLYFVRSTPKFEGWRIKLSHCTKAGWSEPADPSFAGDGLDADPWFTPNGRTLYFISSRSTGGAKHADTDIWRIERGADGRWGAPQRLPEPVNTTAYEWFPHQTPDGWLYFGSGRPGGLGKTDIWRARQGAKGWIVENAGPTLNSAGSDFEPLPSPDGKRMIVQSDDGYVESRMTAKGWSPRVKLGPEINANGTEVGATISPTGRTVMFARDTGQPDSGEFFVWHAAGPEAWPPKCPR